MNNSYPKWLYHATEVQRIVDTPAQHAALPPGWAESPTEALALAETPVPEPAEPDAPDAPALIESPEAAEALADLPKRRGRPAGSKHKG